MNHVYNVCSCHGGFIMSVEITLPDGCNDPLDSEACSEAISAAGCRPGEICDGCYDNRFHANYVGPAEEFFPTV